MSSEHQQQQQQPRGCLKQGLAIEDIRRKRQEQSISLRKNRREESVQKRRQMVAPEAIHAHAVSSSPFLAPRQMGASGDNGLSTPVKSSAAHANLTVEQRLAMLPKFVSDLQYSTSNRQVKFDAVVNIRKLLSLDRNPYINEVIQSGALPLLLNCLSEHADPELQCESAWAVTNVASGSSAHTRAVVESGAVPVLVQIMNQSNCSFELKDQCAWALGNIAGDCPEFRDLCLNNGTLMAVLSFMHAIIFTNMSKVALLRNSTWAVSNLCRGKPQPQWKQVESALPAVVHILEKVQDEETIIDACWALSYMSDDTSEQNDRIQAVLNSGVVPKLVSLLSHVNCNVRVPALRAIGNIVTGTDEQTQRVLEYGLVAPLSSLITHGKRNIRKEACWTISNITAGTTEQISKIVCSDILPKLLTVLKEDVFEVQKEACWAVSNATATWNFAIINSLVKAGALEAYCRILSNPDSGILLVALEGLENILLVGKRNPIDGNKNRYLSALEEVGGLDTLESLQKHENDKIYKRTSKIISTYCDVEEEETEAPAPIQNINQFSFSVDLPKSAALMQPIALPLPAATQFSFGKPNTQQQIFSHQPAGGFTFGSVSL